MSILGNPVIRREDPAFLTGAATYVDDLQLHDAARVVFVRSTVAHARLTTVDVTAARGLPGVVGIFTADDVTQLGLAPNVRPTFPETMRRPFLARDVVRYVGEPIVAIVAETVAAAVDAAEWIVVDYDVLETVVDVETAARDDLLLFPEHGTNVAFTIDADHSVDFSTADVVVSERIVNQRLTAAPIEPRGGAAHWTDDGRLVHYSACQGAHPSRALLAEIYELDPDQVRVIVPDVGGGFGAKSRTYPDEALLGWFARELGRPVAWTETRSENLAAMPHGRGQIQYARLGGTRDGTITAYQLDVIQDAGAYPIVGSVLPGMTRQMLTGTYTIADCAFSSKAVVTNTVSTTAYRGAGRPEATVAIERMVDRFAAEIGMDPAEVRRRNLIPRFDEPHTTAIGTSYDVGNYPEALRLALEAVGYDDLRAEQAARRQQRSTRLLGIGIGMYVEITAGAPGGEFGSVQLLPDGGARVLSGATPYGQGHDTTWAMIVADRTGIPFDRIEVVSRDTDQVPRGGLTVGSRSVQIAGSAIAAASAQLVENARQHAADALEAAFDDVVHDPRSGRFHVTGTPTVSMGWSEIAATAAEPLVEATDFTPDMPTFPSGAHVAVVEVDQETGYVELRRIVACDDAGRLINPLIAEGQVHGGIAQGAAQVLFEEISYDEHGTLLTSNFMDYLVISPTELPLFETVTLETPTWVNELGAKGVGESGTIGSIPSVYNAVIDAVAHLGIRHLQMPITPAKLWHALND
ncbi:MAG: xanthine dehydrogenase family protein molybdopterin-binding subunit [Acidimicrobiales bacterium]